MKIVLIGHFKCHGSLRSYNFGKNLAKMGHDVTHISIAHGSRLAFSTALRDGMKIIETPDLLWGRARSGWDPWDVMRRLVRFSSWSNEKIDLIHGFECRPVTIFPILALKKKQQDVVFISDWNDWWGRGGLIEEQRPFWYKPIFGAIETYFEEAFRKKADGVTVIATALADRAHKLGVPRERLHWIPQGVDPHFFKPLPKKRIRDQLGISKETKLAVFSAQVIIDLDLVLSAFVKVCKAVPQAKLMLLGRRSILTQKIAKKNRIEQKIFDLGMIPFGEIPKYLSCADVLLLPFKNKIANIGRWPTKLGEYLSIGRPIVSNPVGDIKNLFERENVGLLAKENADDFADKITYLFDRPGLCEELGDNGHRVAKEKLAWPVLTRRLEDFYYRFFQNS